jgi:hypothetical protein
MPYVNILRFVVAGAVFSLAGLLIAEENERMTNTLRLEDGMESPPATIDDVKWIAGNWTGPAFGGIGEEMWGQPRDGSMMGSYRLVQNDKVIFYEIQTFVEQGNSLVFRLKHFNPDLSGWEDKEASAAVVFPLVKVSDHAVFFDGITFRKLENGTLQLHLRLDSGDGKEYEESFLYQPM